MRFDDSYFRSNGKFLAIQALRIFEIFSALIWASVFSHVEALLVGLGVERNLIDSSAHHWAREMIVTHVKFQSAAKLKFQTINQNTIKEKNQILLKIFIEQ